MMDEVFELLPDADRATVGFLPRRRTPRSMDPTRAVGSNEEGGSPAMTDDIVVGLDVGGTSTRAATISCTGAVLGDGRAGGGNPTSHGARRAAGQLRRAVAAALAGLDPARVRLGCIGLAGAGRLQADPASRAAFDTAWQETGLTCGYTVHSDALVGYASGTYVPDGTILIAGTGAIAVEIRELAPYRTADGHGWLLGDAGSGFWLGREAVRRTLTDLDVGTEPGPLGQAVLSELLAVERPVDRGRAVVDALIQAVTRRPPVALAALAPLVTQAWQAGDPRAGEILTAAAEHLVASVRRVRPNGSTDPVVLGGGLLTTAGPLVDQVRLALREHWPRASLHTAGDGAVAAAWLAARTLPEVDDPIALHRRLFPAAAGSG
jgi:glucosamine kinase